MAVSDLVVIAILAVASLIGTATAQQTGTVTLQVHSAMFQTRSIKFDAQLFTEFFKCLCEGNATNCTASYDITQGDNVVKTLISSGTFNGNQSLPKYYQCELTTYENRLTCLMLNQTSSVCSTTPYFQSSRFNVTPTCEKSCFTVFWKYNENNLPAGWFNQCDANSGCADLTSTSVATLAPTKAPINPSSSSLSLLASTPSSSLSPLASTSLSPPHASSSPSFFSSSSEFSPTSNSSASPLSHSTTPSAGTTLSVPPLVAGFIINFVFGISFASL